MDSFISVRPEHLNHHGNLFGGQLLLWIDEFAWIAAARDFPCTKFVTRALGESLFQKRVQAGSILRFSIKMNRRGKTSVTYEVEVYATEPELTEEHLVFSNTVTFTSIDEHGQKKILPPQ